MNNQIIESNTEEEPPKDNGTKIIKDEINDISNEELKQLIINFENIENISDIDLAENEEENHLNINNKNLYKNQTKNKNEDPEVINKNKTKPLNLNEIDFDNIKYEELFKYVPNDYKDFIKMYFNKYEEIELGELHRIPNLFVLYNKHYKTNTRNPFNIPKII